MKTEPTESLNIKRANIVDKYLPAGDEQRYYERLKMHEELFDLINSHSPKIKQLEWKEDCLFTDIIVSEGFSLQFYEIKIIDNTLYIGDTEQSFKTIDEAKAAAQRDFEKRVMECLE